MHDDEKRLQSLDELVRLGAATASDYCNRGLVFQRKEEYEKALKDFDEAVRIAPQVNPYKTRAWLLATCPDNRVRDAKRAVDDAKQACELSQWHNAICLDTLAAAQAESGSFDEAVQYEQKAIDLTSSDTEKAKYESRLALYRAGKPYREPPPTIPTTNP
jgi:tetratricopeptide (TPR) repeat protein